MLSVAQQTKKSGLDLLKGIITAYEVQVNLVKGICLHEHRIDHIAHLGPSVAAGLGSLLKLNTETIYQSVQQALHTTISTRQSRKGEISSWKAFAPAHAGKLAIEAVCSTVLGAYLCFVTKTGTTLLVQLVLLDSALRLAPLAASTGFISAVVAAILGVALRCD